MRLKAISLMLAIGFALPATAKLANSQFLAGECRGPGGEGPKPLVQLPFALSHIMPYGSANEVVDGLFLPLKRQFAFRDNLGNLKTTMLESHATTLLARTELPLARVRDKQERFLSFDTKPYVFDTFAQRYYTYRPAYSGKIRPLFWNGSTQYSAIASSDENRNANFRVQQ